MYLSPVFLFVYSKYPFVLLRWSQSQSEHPSADYGDYCKRNGSIASSHGNVDYEVRTIRFHKEGGLFCVLDVHYLTYHSLN